MSVSDDVVAKITQLAAPTIANALDGRAVTVRETTGAVRRLHLA